MKASPVPRPLIALLLMFATPLAAATQLSGDRIDGTPVVTTLDAATLPAGSTNRFWVRPADSAIGQGWYVPVIVVRGAKPGPRLLLTAAIHGDELNGIAVIHRLANEIDPAGLAGTLVMLPGLNTPGLLQEA
ncbi:MAG TPA: succinylglutamate desuccinylase/aspartoacylase family protein, partial [Polymorphobacter sp.]|nr:succinylglutamate desuccinylase/aspartoacylase family protein [Polymorphobacter sp.]